MWKSPSRQAGLFAFMNAPELVLRGTGRSPQCRIRSFSALRRPVSRFVSVSLPPLSAMKGKAGRVQVAQAGSQFHARDQIVAAVLLAVGNRRGRGKRPYPLAQALG